MTLEVAGPAPLAAVTAIAAIDSLGLSPGQSVLVVGATGGVGSVAAQLAAHAGTRVIAPTHPADEPYLRELGASEVIDRDRDLAEQMPATEIDALLDLVSYTPRTSTSTPRRSRPADEQHPRRKRPVKDPVEPISTPPRRSARTSSVSARY